MKRQVHLGIYGTISFEGQGGDLAWQLLQTKAMARLRDISLDSVPARFVPHSVPVSRNEHSVATGYLARVLAEREPALAPLRDTLIAAALLHDTGSAPFSHIVEPFLFGLTGRTHEQQTAALLAPGGEIYELLDGHDVDPREVLALILGAHRLPLIAGSIDLDNVSNSIDLLVSLGVKNTFYQPLQLLDAFRIVDGGLVLDTAELDQLIGWRDARAALYRMLYDEPHLSAMAGLSRALEYGFAAEAFDESFFALDESQALTLMRSPQAPPETRELIETLLCWRHFPTLWQREDTTEDTRLLSLYDDWQQRKRFTDQLADALDIPGDELTISIGRMRGPKQIDLPFIGPDAEAARLLFGAAPARQRVAVFAHKRHQLLVGQAEVAAALEELAEALPRVESAHSFC
jgi:HD superfamily phosphohydrolase